MFKEDISLTDPRYSERANLDYAVLKTREELIKLEENPTTQEDYHQTLDKFQYYWRLLQEKYPWKG